MGLFIDLTGVGITNAFSAAATSLFSTGTVTVLSATEAEISYSGFGNVGTVRVGGTGLSHNAGVWSGTVTSFEWTNNGFNLYRLSNISVDAATFGANLASPTGLFSLLYSGNDTFNINDPAVTGPRYEFLGGEGNDRFNMFDNFFNGGLLNGGNGTDSVVLNGLYTNPIELDSNGSDANVVSIETVRLTAGNSYSIVLESDAGQPQLLIDGRALRAGQVLTTSVSFFGAAGVYRVVGGADADLVTTGSGADTVIGGVGNDVINGGAGADRLVGDAGDDTLVGGQGDDTLLGGQGSDTIDMTGGGADVAIGGIGNDTFLVNTGSVNTVDIDAGAGRDTVNLAGTSGHTLTLDDRFTGVEVFNINTTAFETVNVTDATLAANGVMTIDASASTGTLTFNGAAELDGRFIVRGGAGDDSITGGSGADTFSGGAGADQFIYSPLPVAGFSVDTILDFDPSGDTVVVSSGAPRRVGPIGVDQFHTGASAQDAEDRIIYNPANGAVFFDVDGLGGVAQVRLLTIDAGLALTNQNFWSDGL